MCINHSLSLKLPKSSHGEKHTHTQGQFEYLRKECNTRLSIADQRCVPSLWNELSSFLLLSLDVPEEVTTVAADG